MTIRWLAIIVAAFVAVGCSRVADERSSGPTQASFPTSAAATSTTAPSSTPEESLPTGFKSVAGLVLGTAHYPSYKVVVPDSWGLARAGYFVEKYTFEHPPVLGLSVWDVGRVFRDPCHWVGQDYDPGPTVENLVAALVAQPMRNASQPTDVTLAGYSGQYLEWSVPADLKSSTWTDFDACDIDPSDVVHRNFNSWLGNGMGNRYQQVAGQVDRLWVLDADGQRLVIDATYSADTVRADRDELGSVVASLRFAAP
jgi:ribosomal protein S16